MGCEGSDEEKKSTGPSTFYFIKHDFAEDKAEAWWASVSAMMGNAEEMDKMTAAQKAAGFYNHVFMPTSQTLAFCVWEAAAGKTLDDMKTFMESEISPASSKDGVTNTVYPMPAAFGGDKLWDSVLESEVAVKTEEKNENESSFFVIHHEFKEGKASEWWAAMKPILDDPAKVKEAADGHKGKGFSNSAFIATAEEGPCFCIWEAEKGKTKEDMVAFIDTDEASPATDLINVVHMIDPALSGGKPPLKCAF